MWTALEHLAPMINKHQCKQEKRKEKLRVTKERNYDSEKLDDKGYRNILSSFFSACRKAAQGDAIAGHWRPWQWLHFCRDGGERLCTPRAFFASALPWHSYCTIFTLSHCNPTNSILWLPWGTVCVVITPLYPSVFQGAIDCHYHFPGAWKSNVTAKCWVEIKIVQKSSKMIVK